MKKKSRRIKTIFITDDGYGNLLYRDDNGDDATRFRLRHRESVQWVYTEGPYTIDFMGLSPFNYTKFHGNGGATVEKASVVPDRPIGRYEYFVAVQKTVKGQVVLLTDDPDIIIWKPK